MGFTYRKSIGVGPFRINVSGAGVGWSIGGRSLGGGLRTGVSARGRRYTTFSLPGTGIGYRTSGRAGCLVFLALAALTTATATTLLWHLA